MIHTISENSNGTQNNSNVTQKKDSEPKLNIYLQFKLLQISFARASNVALAATLIVNDEVRHFKPTSTIDDPADQRDEDICKSRRCGIIKNAVSLKKKDTEVL